MVFSSTEFLFAFLVLFFAFYYGAGALFGLRGKNIALLVFSLIFYGWGEPVYVLLMVYSTVLDYTSGRMIEKGTREGKPWLRRLFLGVSLVGNLVPLCLFKYLDMFLLTTNHLFDLTIPTLGLKMPLGISFYTFQTMSYSIDVFRGKVKAQHNILFFGAYVVMFPQLIAGPVVRYADVERELNDRTETLDGVAAGLRRFSLGLAKKVLIANTMASVCDGLFPAGGENLGAIGAWVAILAYTFQIYFDFSGYSDMAMGLGRMMGFTYPENFNYPYISRSVTEFWRRWHITMSSFFRDYIYIPLGGSRVPVWRWIVNVLIVWAATGLWHGASWNFVLWGLYFALLLMLEKFVLRRVLEKTHVVSRLYAMFAVVMGWVLFNATEDRGGLPWLAGFVKAMFGGYGAEGTNLMQPALIQIKNAGVNTVFLLAFAAAILFSTPILPWIKGKLAAGKETPLKTVLCYAGDIMLLALVVFSVIELETGAYNPFIYFRF